MSKWFSIKVTAVKVVLVEVEDDDSEAEDTAMNLAFNEAFGLSDGVVEASSEGEVTADRLEGHKRHADQVLPIPA